jgi:hypothetical protein
VAKEVKKPRDVATADLIQQYEVKLALAPNLGISPCRNSTPRERHLALGSVTRISRYPFSWRTEICFRVTFDQNWCST